MCDKRCGIYLSRRYQAQYLGTISPIHTTGLEDKILAIHLRQGQ